MGLVELLGYRAPEPGPLQKVVNRLAGTRPGAAVAAPILRRLDLMALRSGGGAVTERMGGQPVIWLEVPRRHRGDSRLVPLLPIPFGAHIAVIGSNFGREREPAWVADLLAARGIEVTMGERSVRARSRPAAPDEAEEVWRAAGHLYSGYLRYRRQVTSREIPVFVLEPEPRLPSSS